MHERFARIAAALTAILWLTPSASSCSAATSGRNGPPLAVHIQPLADSAKRMRNDTETSARAWQKLSHLALRIGPRLSGSAGMTRAIEWARDTLEADGHANVRLEPAMVPAWTRGKEAMAMVSPAVRALPVLGLGGTVATPPGGLVAEVEVVRSEADVAALGSRAKGKLLLIDVAMPAYHPDHGTGYGATVKYRYAGPRWAAQAGAAGVLMRSLTARSLATPHTGATSYKDLVTRLPAAAVTTEDSEAIALLRAQGVPVRVRLELGGRDEGWVPSANVTAEIVGHERPEEVVVISAHLDAWDVGHGAHDDGGGCVMAMEALSLIRRLGLRPKRTIRVVLWTNEENGLRGARDYGFGHTEELGAHVAAIEADSGAYAPRGYRVQHRDEATQTALLGVVSDMVALSAPIDAGHATVGFSGADVRAAMWDAGVPLLGHWMDMSRYFDIHHTHADTLDKVSPHDLHRNVVAMATMAFALAQSSKLSNLGGRKVAAVSPLATEDKALEWLHGYWLSDDGALEVWAKPHGPTMVGMGASSALAATSHERMRIASDGNGKLVLWAQPHGAAVPVAFVGGVEGSGPAATASFHNVEHDFPQSIRYARSGNMLTTTVSGPGREPIVRSFTRQGDALDGAWLPHQTRVKAPSSR